MNPTAVLAVLLLLLAGCTQSPGAGPAASVVPHAHDDRGMVHGVVVDEAVVPVAGAVVRISGGGAAWNTTTDADGGFRLGPLASGAYAVEVHHPDFLPAQALARVQDGERASLRLQVVHRPDAAAFVQAYQFDGYMECDTTVGSPCGTVNWAAGAPVLRHADRTEWPLPRAPTWVQAELVWDATQAAGDELRLIVDHVDAEGTRTKLGWTPLNEGPSPLMLAADREGRPICSAVECQDPPVDMTTWDTLRVVAWVGDVDATRPPCAVTDLAGQPCTGAGVALQQEFTLFAHAFFGLAPEAGWRFVQDGAP